MKFFILSLLTLLICFYFMDSLDAQCPMCRMSAESNLKDGGSEGKGLNTGILFLLSTPYLIIGTLGLMYYRNKRKLKEDQSA